MATIEGSLFRDHIVSSIPPGRAAQAVRREIEGSGNINSIVNAIRAAKVVGDFASPFVERAIRSSEEGKVDDLRSAAERRVAKLRDAEYAKRRADYSPQMHQQRKAARLERAGVQGSLGLSPRGGPDFEQDMADAQWVAETDPPEFTDPKQAWYEKARKDYAEANADAWAQRIKTAGDEAAAGVPTFSLQRAKMIDALKAGDRKAAQAAIDEWEKGGRLGARAKNVWERISGSHVARHRYDLQNILSKFPTDEQLKASRRKRKEAKEDRDWKMKERAQKQKQWDFREEKEEEDRKEWKRKAAAAEPALKKSKAQAVKAEISADIAKAEVGQTSIEHLAALNLRLKEAGVQVKATQADLNKWTVMSEYQRKKALADLKKKEADDYEEDRRLNQLLKRSQIARAKIQAKVSAVNLKNLNKKAANKAPRLSPREKMELDSAKSAVDADNKAYKSALVGLNKAKAVYDNFRKLPAPKGSLWVEGPTKAQQQYEKNKARTKEAYLKASAAVTSTSKNLDASYARFRKAASGKSVLSGPNKKNVKSSGAYK